MLPSPNALFKNLALDERQSQKNRISALNKIGRPTLALLRQLIRPDVPPRLRFRASELYELELARRDLRMRNEQEQEECLPEKSYSEQ
jgi:hypothetical protein